MSSTPARGDWRRALVTGGAGFLGSHLCERLLDAGLLVDCADNLLSGNRENIAHLEETPGFRFVECDVSEPECVERLPGPYDLVLHFACPASPADYLRHPIQTLDVGSAGTRHALALAARDGARFLLASTSEVYGDPLVHPQREDYWGNVNPIGPRSVYDESKRFAEALVTAHASALGTDAGIVRLFNTYGPRMRGHDGRVVPTFIAQALGGEPLTVAGDGTQTRSLCFVDDTVDGVLLVAASRAVRPVNIGGGHEVSVLEIAEKILELTGSTSRIAFVERPADDPARRRPDTTLARELLRWQPSVDWEEGLKRTISAVVTTG
ncbi:MULTISPECIES: NAD-dependent epimerase/dehydratase family protein [Streptomyces]|uniref:GDP-mannose 4,6-dehydratase n=1 Tax=Streptomyces evansiae TaxID=3075535 RepID=A0ABU2QUV7_9ACTN|nr:MULTISPECIES: NAD-dependent epimerase/dehydratase family protein [unclassified Streptomyces]MDT0407731.1 GDP-mannose 4,6-dehydratase [Streptomyces sp. DSM 41979]MYQ57009.1 NAD-dependent epimerase/dehydratase family protein [Streptomyces sp. SID4926]SCE45586.1 dTDP-glucose 4,6-dehydratase [Streptomyces sp. DfronAA-171]